MKGLSGINERMQARHSVRTKSGTEMFAAGRVSSDERSDIRVLYSLIAKVRTDCKKESELFSW
jgi:hypothetical protein